MNKLKYIPGDLVTIETKSIKPRVVKVSNVDEDSIIYCEGWGEVCLYDEIKPIPLTKDILLKNGWKLYEHHEKVYWNDDDPWISYNNITKTYINLRFYTDCGNSFLPYLKDEEISGNPIKYVHELQHLLFGLDINSEMEV